MPGPAELTVGAPVAATAFTTAPEFLLPEEPELAVLASLTDAASSETRGAAAVVIGVDLVEALAPDGIEGLDAIAALQPALDAAAAAVDVAAGPGERLDVESALSAVLARPDAYLVPLSDPSGLVMAAVIVALTVVAPAQVAIDQSQPDNSQPDSEQPDSEQPDSEQPGSSQPDSPQPDNSQPDSEQPDSPQPDSEQPGSPQPDSPQPVSVPPESVQPESVEPPAPRATVPVSHGGMDLLRDVGMEVTVELGRTRMTVRELLQLTLGAVVELDRAASSPADLLVSGTVIAGGEVVVIDENFGLRITQVTQVTPAEAPGRAGAPGVPARS